MHRSTPPTRTPPPATNALWQSTLAFALCFAAWTILSVVGLPLQQELRLSATQLSLLIALPILTGSVCRPLLGILTDRFGGRLIMGLLLLVSGLAMYLLTFAHNYWQALAAAFCLGLAGGSFAVGVAHLSAWYEKAHQGFALGIFGMGASGTVLTNLAGPSLLSFLSWQGVVTAYAAVLVVTGALFLLFGRNPEKVLTRQSLAQRLAPLRELQVWHLSFDYLAFFGAFVALALWLPHYLTHVYGLSLTTASLCTMTFTLPGSLGRGPGGWLADRYGARAMLYLASLGAMACALLLCLTWGLDLTRHNDALPAGGSRPSPFFWLLILALACFIALGMAAVFKRVADCYSPNAGVVGGVVSMIGGLGGFVMPLTFNAAYQLTLIWQTCFVAIFGLLLVTLIWLHFSATPVAKGEQPPQSTL